MNKFIKIILCAIFALFVATDKTILYQNISNNTFRIDIFGQDDTNDVQILQDGTNLFSSTPTWCKNCIILTGDFNKHKNTKIKLKANKNETINIKLRGKDLKQNGRHIPLFVNYSGFIVNQTPIEIKKQNIWHDNPYIYKIDTKRNDTIEISVLPKKPSMFNTLLNCHIIIYLFIIAFLFIYFVPQIIEKHIKKTETTFPDFIFIVIFLLLLIIPMSDISRSKKSDQENRILATKPQLIIDNKINEKYGTQFDAWFNDRFNGRQNLLGMHTYIKYHLEKQLKNDKMIMSKDNYIFDIDRINKLNTDFKPEKVVSFQQNLKKLKSFCDKNNIRLYFLLVPIKEDVLSGKLNYVQHKNIRNTHIDIARLFSDIGISFTDPYDAFLSHQNQEDLFFQTDHHWTEYGTFVAYQELSDKMNIKPLIENDFNIFYENQPRLGSFKNMFDRPFYIGSNCNSLSLRKNLCPLSKKYKYFDHKNKDNLIVKNGPMPMSKITHFASAPNSENVTILGDSHGGFLMEFFAYTFKNVQMLRINNQEKNLSCNIWDMSRFEKHILDFHTNILLVYLIETDLSNIQFFYK